jgi:hypothetical protein
MKDTFARAWILPRDLTCDESLWSFKGRTFLKRFMKDKPKKYGFLEYALCCLNGYFAIVTVHHVPGKDKRKKRKLDDTNLDLEALKQIELQSRYGECGALLVRLASKLKYNGHHIIGDNAFSSVQLAVDLKAGTVKGMNVKKCDYTGTQNCQKPGKKPVHFAEYKNQPVFGGRIKKHDHTWFSDNNNSVSLVKMHDRKHVHVISTVTHGSEMTQKHRVRENQKVMVDLQASIVEYSNKKVGVDVGDQLLRSRTSWADTIKSSGWQRKWGMHAVQQVHANARLCWQHSSMNPRPDQYLLQNQQKVYNGKLNWAFQIGCMKGMLEEIGKGAQVAGKRPVVAAVVEQHTIVKRGKQWSGMSCAVCIHLDREKRKLDRPGAKRKYNRPKKSIMWCPHPHCLAHACTEHRGSVHDYFAKGVELALYHREARVESSVANPSKRPRKRKPSSRSESDSSGSSSGDESD